MKKVNIDLPDVITSTFRQNSDIFIRIHFLLQPIIGYFKQTCSPFQTLFSAVPIDKHGEGGDSESWLKAKVLRNLIENCQT